MSRASPHPTVTPMPPKVTMPSAVRVWMKAKVQTAMPPMLPNMDAVSLGTTVSLGASLRDRATLPSPLRGLGPSGGYPSRLHSLRSLRAPLARRLAALTAVAGPTPSRRGSTVSSAGPPRSPRAGAARHARRSPRLARPGRLRRLRASPQLAAAALRASPVTASPDTGLRTAPCSRVRTSADTSARASGSVLRTTACGSGRTARHSSAVAAPLRRVLRLRFPEPRCCRFGRPDRPGRPWVSHPTHLWCMARNDAYASSSMPSRMILRTPVHVCRAGNSASHLRRTRETANYLKTLPGHLAHTITRTGLACVAIASWTGMRASARGYDPALRA